MPIVRVDTKGKEVDLKKWSRRIAFISTALVAGGVVEFFVGDQAIGLLVVMLGGALSSIWNLADD